MSPTADKVEVETLRAEMQQLREMMDKQGEELKKLLDKPLERSTVLRIVQPRQLWSLRTLFAA